MNCSWCASLISSLAWTLPVMPLWASRVNYWSKTHILFLAQRVRPMDNRRRSPKSWTEEGKINRKDPHGVKSVGRLISFLGKILKHISVQFSCSVMSDSLRPHGLEHAGFLVLHDLPEFAQTHVLWGDDAIQPPLPLSPPSPPALNLSQHQGLFQWVSSSHQAAKVSELQFQHQSFQWIFSVDFL